MASEPGRPLLAAHWSETSIAVVLRPIQNFIHTSAAGGTVLMVATVIALGLANSSLAMTYDAVLRTHIVISIGDIHLLDESVLHWINDGLMAIFFFLVGLEIKREVRAGELASLRAALLPIISALGGVAVPALLYGDTSAMALGILVGLVLDKPIGILTGAWIAVRLGWSVLPQGVQWSHMVDVGFLAGIGFTMSLFIASLGFGDSALLETAKLGILGASLLAGALGVMLLHRGQASAYH